MNGRSVPRRADECNSYWHLGHLVSLLVTGDDTQGQFATLEVRVTRGHEPPCCIHHEEDAIVYVLEGSLTCHVGKEQHAVSAGAALLLPRGVEHGFSVDSDEASLLVTIIPAGFERYFQEVGIVARGGDAEPRVVLGNIDVERLVTVAARYGVEITGPAPADARVGPDSIGGADER